MKLYVDTADRSAAESLLATGVSTASRPIPRFCNAHPKGVADLKEIYSWAIDAGAQEVFFKPGVRIPPP